jgi:xanthine dehydrogenase accessory factor
MGMLILVRGAGDLASGVAYRLTRAGLRVVMSELPQPLAVRRLVSFSEAIYAGSTTVEGLQARRVDDPTDTLRVLQVLAKGVIPVMVDPDGRAIGALHPGIVIDARMLKQPAALIPERVSLIVGLGPGFTPGKNCHAAIETNRGPRLGRVYWDASPEENTGLPEAVIQVQAERVLRAQTGGELITHAQIGEVVEAGQLIAEVAGQAVKAPFRGALRGLLPQGTTVQPGLKIGDLDPRADPGLCTLISDKALAIGGAALEAILTRPEIRTALWT